MSHLKGSPKDTSVPQLAALRSGRGISLEQVADATKISIRSLKAIEAGEFKKLPGGIYTRNYIRQYAQFVGVDECQLLRDCDQASSDVAETITVERSRGPLSKLLDMSWALLNL